MEYLPHFYLPRPITYPPRSRERQNAHAHWSFSQANLNVPHLAPGSSLYHAIPSAFFASLDN